jgi:hypothetical protein
VQLAAGPLQPGDELVIRGQDDQRGIMWVRSRTNDAITVAGFSEKQVAGATKIVAERRGARAIPILRLAGGRTDAPMSTAIHWLDAAQ